jgi:ABC-type transport system involved in multi-copper enzyme maturation permease subunit
VTATLVSEFTKLRTQRGTLIALLAMAVLMIGMTAFGASQTRTDARFAGTDDIVQIGLFGIVFAQIAAVVAAGSLMTSEFATGMIRTSFLATQDRSRLLAAKAIVLSAVVFPIALVSSGVAFVIAQSLLHDRGYVPPAYPFISITDGPAARAVLGTALLLTILALIALGIATVIRHSGATIATGIGLLFVPLLMFGLLPENIKVRIEQFTPIAGLAIQSTNGRMLAAFGGSDHTRVSIDRNGVEHIVRAPMPIGHWQGLGVAFAWSVAALTIGALALRRRDA